MVNRSRRDCPICGRRDLLKLSNHLSQFHGLSSEERQRWLQRVSHHHPPPVVIPVEQHPLSPSNCPVVSIPSTDYPLPFPTSSDVVVPQNRPLAHCMDTRPHPDFAFQHPYSMMVVGPSQCGKTHFVHQLLTHKCIAYPNKKPWRVCWYYNQWQPQYEEIQRDLKNKIHFAQGLPELDEDLSNINPSKHTIIVLDDLMTQAKDSPVVSKLFTQGRHRNTSVLLLLQNMFPKGKYNTDISRNATYKVLFRSPGDRKQIDIMAEQTFAKDRPRFMQAYHRETDRPYGYLVVDNHPRTTSEHQVVGNVFGDCYTYPHITSTFPRESYPAPGEFVEQPNRKRPALENRDSKKCKVRRVERSIKKKPLTKQVTRKRPAPVINQSSIKKRETNDRRVRKRPAPFIKKSEVQAAKKRKAIPKRVPVKKRKSKSVPRKQPVYDSSSEEDIPEEGGDEEITSEEDSEISYNEGEEVEPFHEEQPAWLDPYWGNPREDVEEENQYGGWIWQKPGFRYYCQSRGGGGRTIYE